MSQGNERYLHPLDMQIRTEQTCGEASFSVQPAQAHRQRVLRDLGDTGHYIGHLDYILMKVTKYSVKDRSNGINNTESGK